MKIETDIHVLVPYRYMCIRTCTCTHLYACICNYVYVNVYVCKFS
jgi:hypothetical protein